MTVIDYGMEIETDYDRFDGDDLFLSLSPYNYIHLFLCVHEVVRYEHNEMASQLIILSKVIIKFTRVGVYIVQNP